MEATGDSPLLRVTLSGPATAMGRLRLDVLLEVSQGLQTAVNRIGYALRGRPTRRPGRVPVELADLTRLALVAFREGSAVLEIGLAEPVRPFDELDLGAEAIDRLGEGLAALASGRRLPEPWDAGVLESVEELMRVFERGVDEIAVDELDARVPRRARLTRETRERVLRELRAPSATAHREIEGRLLMADFDEARLRCRVHPAFGRAVVCSFAEHQRQRVRDLVTEYVRVVGEGEIDEVNGSVKLLRLEEIEPVELPVGVDASAFWREPSIEEIAEAQGVSPVEKLEDLAADLWESDEDLEDFLEAIYKSRDAGLA